MSIAKQKVTMNNSNVYVTLQEARDKVQRSCSGSRASLCCVENAVQLFVAMAECCRLVILIVDSTPSVRFEESFCMLYELPDS